jgi:TolB-like protein
MKKIFLIFLILSVFQINNLIASDDIVMSKLNSITKKLVSAYISNSDKKITIAVLPFHTNEELAKRRIGSIFAEYLMHSFRNYSNFIVVDRIELDKIFKELKLSALGVVDQEDALKIGKLAGAKLQVFGSIDKIKNKYHINARIVDTETGEIVSTAYETIPSDVFDEKAGVKEPPETEAIGFYFLYHIRNLPVVTKSYTKSYTEDIGSWTENYSIGKGTLKEFGLGIKYTPIPKFQLDISAIYISKNSGHVGLVNYYNSYSGKVDEASLRLGEVSYRFLFGYKFNLIGEHIRLIPNIGYVFHRVTSVWDVLGGNYNTPVVATRLEFVPQNRFFISFSSIYELKQGYLYDKQFPSIKTNKFDKLSVEFDLGFYF